MTFTEGVVCSKPDTIVPARRPIFGVSNIPKGYPAIVAPRVPYLVDFSSDDNLSTKAGAVSRGHRNNAGERFRWCLPIKCLSRAAI